MFFALQTDIIVGRLQKDTARRFIIISARAIAFSIEHGEVRVCLMIHHQWLAVFVNYLAVIKPTLELLRLLQKGTIGGISGIACMAKPRPALSAAVGLLVRLCVLKAAADDLRHLLQLLAVVKERLRILIVL